MMNAGGRLKTNLGRFQSLIALAAIVAVIGFTSDQFLTVDNGLTVLRQISINLCLSIGMTLVILSGGIDLSVGSVLALSGAVAAGLLKNGIAISALGVREFSCRIFRIQTSVSSTASPLATATPS